MNMIHDQVTTDQYSLINGDSCEVLSSLPTESVHLSIHSPPFAKKEGGSLYFYSSSPRDLSNASTYQEFWSHYKFIVRELLRLTLPGRMCAVHAMDTPNGNTGDDDLTDFTGDIIRAYTEEGWRYKARFCIWKDALVVRNRTMAKSLAHKTIVTDSAYSGNAGADYLLVFQKKGKNPIPIPHPNGLLSYAGERQIPADLLPYRGWTGNQIENRYSHWCWQRYANSVWDDIRISNVLPFQSAKEEDDEKHVHPLQLDVIERCLVLWSNPGETVLSPFMGVGSEIYGSVVNGRKGIGIELKSSYYQQALRALSQAKRQSNQESLFALEA